MTDDDLAFAGAPNCPVDLESMEVTDDSEWPVWECPVCGLHRYRSADQDGWWTTLNLPGRQRQPLVLEELANESVVVKYDRGIPVEDAGGPWATWRDAEQAARAWLEAHP